MPTGLLNYTLAQMQAASPTQVTAAKTVVKNFIDGLSKADFIRLILYTQSVDVKAIIKLSDTPTRVIRPDGQVRAQTTVHRDVLGAATGSTVVAHTYYEDEPGKPVDTISITEKDAAGKTLTVRTIKHFKDGRQPL